MQLCLRSLRVRAYKIIVKSQATNISMDFLLSALGFQQSDHHIVDAKTMTNQPQMRSQMVMEFEKFCQDVDLPCFFVDTKTKEELDIKKLKQTMVQ